MKKLLTDLPTAIFMVIAITAFLVPGAMGQSGRSIPKRPQTVAVPIPEPTPLVRPKPKPDFNVRVAIEITHRASFVFPMPERMRAWFMERLEKTPLLDVRGAIDANRRDAIDLAEKETDTYVVWLQLEDGDPMGRSRPHTLPEAGQVWINLSIFSPVTGKTKFSRKIVLNQNTSGGGTSKVIRSCYGGVYGNDYLLLEASLVAAETVMTAFNIPIPPDCKTNRYPYENHHRHFAAV